MTSTNKAQKYRCDARQLSHVFCTLRALTIKSSPSKAKVGKRIVRRHARKAVERDKRRRGVEILHAIFQIHQSLDLYREPCITNALHSRLPQRASSAPSNVHPNPILHPSRLRLGPLHRLIGPHLQRRSIRLHRPNAPTQTTSRSLLPPRASDYAGSVGVSSTSTTIRWVQSGMVVPDEPSMGHAVAFWLNQYALHRLSVKAAWNVYTMGQ